MFGLQREINAIRLNPDYVSMRAPTTGLLAAFAGRLLAFGGGIVRSLAALPSHLNSLTRGGAVSFVCFTSTTNQTSALEPIIDPIDGVGWVTVNQPPHAGKALAFPGFVVSVVSILTLPATLAFAVVFLLFQKGYGPFGVRARALAFSFDEVLRTYGYLAAAHVLLARHRPDVIIMSNDHNAINRALCLAGNARGMKTIYVQHAPVTGVFPRLIFSHAFLDSEVSADIYRQRPTTTAIEVPGAARYDDRFRPEPGEVARRGKVVSFCFNKIDDPARTPAYIDGLSARGWRVIVRPHPAMTAADLAFLPGGLEIDRAPIHEHLRKVRFLIAGNSGVMLDAFMAGVIPVTATDLSGVTDYYGFLDHGAVYPVELGLLDKFDEQCESWTLDALSPGMKAFNAAIGTPDMYSIANRIRRRILALASPDQGQEGPAS